MGLWARVRVLEAILLVVAGLWTTSKAQECGHGLQTRIVGGTDASEGHWPWQVDIQKKGEHVCGGTLISENWVLSAAHCFPSLSDLSSYTIYAGRLQLHGWNPYETSHGISRVVVPFGYTDAELGWDIALVRLISPVVWSEVVKPICLPDSDVQFAEGTLCTITGWGDIRDGVSLQGVGTLQQVQVPIIGQPACQQMFDGGKFNIRHDMICAGYKEGGKDSCQGDSGGPLVCQSGSGNWVQAGIVSFGLGCAQPNQPGVYARVSAFTEFIQDNVKELRLYSAAQQNWSGWTITLIRTISVLMIVLLT